LRRDRYMSVAGCPAGAFPGHLLRPGCADRERLAAAEAVPYLHWQVSEENGAVEQKSSICCSR